MPHTYIHTHIHTYINTYIHTYIHTYIIHTYVHTYIHIYRHHSYNRHHMQVCVVETELPPLSTYSCGVISDAYTQKLFPVSTSAGSLPISISQTHDVEGERI